MDSEEASTSTAAKLEPVTVVYCGGEFMATGGFHFEAAVLLLK